MDTSDRERRSSEATRVQLIRATAELLQEHGTTHLSVTLITTRAGISRTAFYRQFDTVYDVVRALLEQIAHDLAAQAGPWFNDPSVIGTRQMIHANAIRSGRAIAPHATLLCAIVDAAGFDESLRRLWHERIVQPRIMAAAAAIRRDQARGTIRPDLDPDDTAYALTLMGEQLALEVLGRQHGTVARYARILSPIWEAVLFGITDRP